MWKFDALTAGTKVRAFVPKVIGFVGSFGPAIIGVLAIVIAQTNVTGSMPLAAVVVGVTIAMAWEQGRKGGRLEGMQMAIEVVRKTPIHITTNLINNTDEELTITR